MIFIQVINKMFLLVINKMFILVINKMFFLVINKMFVLVINKMFIQVINKMCGSNYIIFFVCVKCFRQTYLLDNAHNFLVRDIDFNPNKQYYMATCGDDCKTKFWDTRKTSEPLRVLNDHSHWYNFTVISVTLTFFTLN